MTKGRARDSQRSKYWASICVMETVARSLSEREITNLLLSVHDRAFLLRRYRPALSRPFEIKLLGGKLIARRDLINIPKAHYTDWNVVTKVARLISYRLDPRAEWAWYGWQFCAVLLDVTQALMGREAMLILKESMRSHRVRWKPKATRTVTPEMIERLKKARALQEGGSST